MKFSLYDNAYATKPKRSIDLEEAYNIVSTGSYILSNDLKDSIQKLRIETEKAQQDKIKNKLPVFVFSGEFAAERKENASHVYSNLLCVDIDGLEPEQRIDLFEQFKKWGFVKLMFTSPRGNGIKLVIEVDCKEEDYKKVYKAVMLFIRDKFKLPLKGKEHPNGLDTVCQDIARCCYLSFDANAHLDLWAPACNTKDLLNKYKDELKEPVKQAKNTQKQAPNRTTNTGSNPLDIIEHICLEAETKGISLSNSHEENIRIGWSLLSVNADAEYFHRITKLNPAYDFDKMQKRYEYLSKRENKFSLGTLVFMAINAGMKLPESMLEDNLTDLQYVRNWLTSQFSFRFNEISGKVEYSEDKESWKPLEDFIINGWLIKLKDIRLSYVVDGKTKTKRLKLPKSDLYDLIYNYDFSEKVNPVVDMFKEFHNQCDINQANPLEEVQKWCKGYNYGNPEFTESFWMDWFGGVVHNLTSDSYYDKIMVLSGGGGTGKTFGITERLCEPFKEYLTTNFSWNSSNKDDLSKITKYLFILDDELNTSRKADVEMIKNITSMSHTDIREAYARTDSRRPRIANFIATTNNSQFLTDLTGNRRFLVLNVESGNRDIINGIDYKKLWAEVWNHFHVQKNKSNLSNDIINANNEAFRFNSVEEDALNDCFDFSNVKDGACVNADYIESNMKEVIEFVNAETGNTFKVDNRTKRLFDAILSKYELNNKQRKHNKKNVRGWFLKKRDTIVTGYPTAKSVQFDVSDTKGLFE